MGQAIFKHNLYSGFPENELLEQYLLLYFTISGLIFHCDVLYYTSFDGLFLNDIRYLPT